MPATYALMGFREDSGGKLHAAFRHATGGYAFEIPAPTSLLTVGELEKEQWARRSMHKRGHRYDGLHLSDQH